MFNFRAISVIIVVTIIAHTKSFIRGNFNTGTSSFTDSITLTQESGRDFKSIERPGWDSNPVTSELGE